MKNAFKTYGLQTAEFFVLAVHVSVLGPILLAVSLVRTGRPIKRYAYLFHRNVLASYFRARIDFRFGGFHSCARRLNMILATLEDQLPSAAQPQPFPHSPFIESVDDTLDQASDQARRAQKAKRFDKTGLDKGLDKGFGELRSFPGVTEAQAFPDLSEEQMVELAPIIAVYANLALCYFKMGSVEAACQVVVRAHNKIGVQALPTLLDLDHQASQIVLASLAACRILENGGTATVVVKESSSSLHHDGGMSPAETAGQHSQNKDRSGMDSAETRSNVIPFPSPISSS